MKTSELLDLFASHALSALITKMPFYDTEGEFGKKVTSEEITNIKKDIAATAYEYASYMIISREHSQKWLSENYPQPECACKEGDCCSNCSS